eukprot:GEZU01036228.1.p1 GENE.GEZU01036228.1~~GEZU01036228.1.p1  ORF type:complete len:393 (-),score=137.37 GEZU01036228.1:440-1618(-)
MSKEHKFWDSQPVPKFGEKISEFGPIDEPKTVDQVRKEPYDLPDAFEWIETDVDDDNMIQQIYDLLEKNYVEDDDAMFRFAYPIEFLRWALKPPGYLKEWHIGVRVKASKKLVAFISAIPATVQVYKDKIKMVEINFLCVNKQLRSKRLAPLLIKEITRRVNLTDIWQAVYTAGILLPKPVAKCQYWHRSLNPGKLIPTGFSGMPPKFKNFKDPMAMVKRYYQVPDKPQIPGLRPLKKEDVPSARELLMNYLQKFDIYVHFNEEEFAHWFLPRDGVINSFVVENPKTKKITDFLSFYTLPSTIIGNEKFKILKAAYSFYNVNTSVDFKTLMSDALVCANKLEFDVFNALNLMENEPVFQDLKFGQGDGFLHYYLYNWKCPDIPPNKVGLVML